MKTTTTDFLKQHPVWVLVISFLTGMFLDALAERAGAQETTDSSATTIRRVDRDNLSGNVVFGESRRPGNAGFSSTATQDGEVPSQSGYSESELTIDMPLSAIRVRIATDLEIEPTDRSERLDAQGQSVWNSATFQDRLAAWEAPNIRYGQLYFEDVALERYGYTRGPWRQPIASAGFIAKSFFAFPLNASRQPPWCCDSPLGFCRPGGPAPFTEPRWLLWR